MQKNVFFLMVMLLDLSGLFAQPVKVLFIGNGILSNREIHYEFRDLARSGGYEVIIDSYMRDNYALTFHSGLMGDQGAYEKINSDLWDYVILQEHTLLPVIPRLTTQFTLPAIHDLEKAILWNNRCTRSILFLTWARQFGEQHCIWVDSLGYQCTMFYQDYFHMQDSVEMSYLRIADSVNMELAPVGIAWRNSFRANPDMPLFWGSSNLSNRTGAYLSACVLYATIFQESPAGLDYHSVLNEEDALFLQKIAEETVLPDRMKWRLVFREDLPQPDFDFVRSHNHVQFIDRSTNGNSWFWDFGDGSISREMEPNHVFPDFGTYEVCLKHASEDRCPQVKCRELTLEEMVQFFPNPFGKELQLSILKDTEGEVTIEWISTDGSVVYAERWEDIHSGRITIDTRSVPSGTYIIRVSASGIMIARTMVKI